MPEVYVHAAEGRTPEQKKNLMKDITDAVVKNFGVPIEAVVVTIVESPKINKAKGGVLSANAERPLSSRTGPGRYRNLPRCPAAPRTIHRRCASRTG